MMRMPAFWRRASAAGRVSPLARIFAPLGWVYGTLTLNRMRRSGWRAGVPVISVGNFTLGGAGKTPTAMALAEALAARGEAPFFVTRGYGGREPGPLRADPGRHTARDIGDEPLLLARIAPTIIARDRAAGARLAISQGASVIILDDALQNPALEKDFSLAVIDGAFGLGNGQVIPAGPLRAPLEGMLGYVDTILVVGDGEPALIAPLAAQMPVFYGTIRPRLPAQTLAGQRVVAFSGIGLPEKFEATLAGLGASIVGTRRFGDHHPYSADDARTLLALAMKEQALLVTTEKDHVRLAGTGALDELAKAAQSIPIRLEISADLTALIYRVLVSARSRLSTASGPA